MVEEFLGFVFFFLPLCEVLSLAAGPSVVVEMVKCHYRHCC